MDTFISVVEVIFLVVGGWMDSYGYSKFDEANKIWRSTHLYDFTVRRTMNEAYLYLIFGTIILIIGIGLLIYELFSKAHKKADTSNNKYMSRGNFRESTSSPISRTIETMPDPTSVEEDMSDIIGSDLYIQLKELDELKVTGCLTDEEYYQKRKQLLGL